MAKEYIEREATIKALMNDAPEQVGYSREDAADCIRYMDAADVEPVVHGEWVQRPNGEVVCNRCGALAAVGNGDALADAQENQHFCFNCGAMMEGVSNHG